MITIQNISPSTIVLNVSKTYLRFVDANRFVHLTETEYLYATENGSNPLTGEEQEDNSSHTWKWISPFDLLGNPIVPSPLDTPSEPSPTPIIPPAPRGGIEDDIRDGIINVAPSQNAVHDALETKAEWGYGSTRPSNPVLGQMWFDRDDKKPYWYTEWGWMTCFGVQLETYEGSLTVTGQGTTQIPFTRSLFDVVVEFNDTPPIPQTCEPYSNDSVTYTIEYQPTPMYFLNINWNILSGGSRSIGWSVRS